MNIDRNLAERSLKKKGFIENRSGNHIWYHHIYNGLQTGVSTKISHSPKIKVISNNLLLNMKRQLRLDKMQDALNLLDCTMNSDEYNRILSLKKIFKYKNIDI